VEKMVKKNLLSGARETPATDPGEKLIAKAIILGWDSPFATSLSLLSVD
jgi:hypothetical protein